MSGQESIRGYIIQTVIAILESLQNDWKSICIEPDTKNDKVDIIWTDANSKEKIYQVKSSIIDFGKTEILNYLLDLYNENSSALSFTVVLVGNSTSSTKKYFKDFGGIREDNLEGKFKSLFSVRDKIKVDFYNLDLLTIKGAIISLIDRFLSLNKINVDYFTKELIYGGLVSQFMFFSTSGKKVSRSHFENELLGWIKHNYSKHISKSNSELLLSFYLTGFSEFKESISFINLPSIEDLDFIIKEKKELIQLYHKVLELEIKIEPEEKIENINSPFGELLKLSTLGGLNKTFPPYKNEPVVISDYEIDDTKKKAKYTLNIELSDDFFKFGDLKESNTSSGFMPWNSGNITFSGTKNEQNKKTLFDDFDYRLENLYDLLKFWSKVQKLSFLPIVLRNESKSFERGLKIKLFFPKDIKIISPRDFPSPKRLDVLKDFNDSDNILNQWFKHHKDSMVNESNSNKMMPIYHDFESYYSISSFTSGTNEKRSMRKNQYYKVLEYLFDFEIYYDNPNYIILECEIDELSANEAISLPSFIFYKSDNEFDIEYEINSKNLSKKINGLLNVE
jgi:hypothetical protein